MPVLRIVNATPRVYVADGFVAPGECVRLLDAVADLNGLLARGIITKHDSTGLSFEWPVDGDPLLESLRHRIGDALRLTNRVDETMRFRRYEKDESHPLHNDSYVIADATLIATAMIYLADTEKGGETHFPAARPDPLLVRPRAGRLLAWFNHREDGARDELAVHEALPVVAGSKTTLTTFLYCALDDAAASPPAEPWSAENR
jgi:hypothetical protein